MRRTLNPLIGIFITVFIDLLAFGMFIPDLQLRCNSLGAKGFLLGLILSSFSITQFLFAPILGRLSDRYGRRPILILSTGFSVLCFLSYAHADSIFWIFLARCFAGISASNVGVAYAYVADVTTEKNRAKGIGLVGAAFGVGFILGAPLGALLVKVGHGEPYVLGYTAVAFAFINFLYILLFLPETHTRSAGRERYSIAYQFKVLSAALKTPKLGLLLILYFVANFAVSNLETTFMQLAVLVLKLDMMHAALTLMLVGLLSAIIQGGVLRVIVNRFGELNLLRAGYIIQAPMLALLPLSFHWSMLLVVIAVYAIGRGLSDPCINALVSKSATASVQGGVFGVTQSVGALARIFGPLAANTLFAQQYWLPYLFAAVLLFIPLIGTFKVSLEKD